MKRLFVLLSTTVAVVLSLVPCRVQGSGLTEEGKREIGVNDDEDALQEDLPKEITNSIGMKMRLIPSGSFMMGASPGDDEAGEDERPRHRVEITRPFYIGVYEVTREQYKKVMEPSSRLVPPNPDRPMVRYLTWKKAYDFCLELSKKEGVTYRLPTEAEWEYACRAGTETKYYWGDDVADADDYAWYENNSDNIIHDVGLKRPNAWGLYDMSGNVWEWCEDSYNEDYYSRSSLQDPLGPATLDDCVKRGGSWQYGTWSISSSNRSSSCLDYCWGKDEGFRVVRLITEDPKSLPDEPKIEIKELPKDVPHEITDSIGMKLRLIPAGSFMMGAVPGDDEAEEDERPRHRVEITKPFYMGVYEVTQSEWLEVMGTVIHQQLGANVRNAPLSGEGPRFPIYYVERSEVKEFCRKLSQKEGVTYRLPSEAEWEYACRAGTATKYFWGDDVAEADNYYNWYRYNYHEVGRKPPNPWGLYDMCGNVSELCEDPYGNYSYCESPGIYPDGGGHGNLFVYRRGLRSSERVCIRSAHIDFGVIGFRVVRELK